MNNTHGRARTNLPAPTARIAAAGLEFSPLCIGHCEQPEVVHNAFEAGINFFFLSLDLYWPVYAPLRKGLTQLLSRPDVNRDDIVIAAAFYCSPSFIDGALRCALQHFPALQYVDILVRGGVDSTTYRAPDSQAQQFNQLRQQIAEREIPALGASFHSRTAARSAIDNADLDIAFIRYNPRYPGAQRDLFPSLPQPGLPVFNFASASYWQPRGQTTSGWQPRVTDCYRFALSRPELSGLLISPDTPAQLSDTLAALELGGLTSAQEAELIELARRQA